MGSRAVAEQRDGGHAGQRVRVLGVPRLGQRERRDRVALLGVERERLAAGRQHGQRRAGGQQLRHEARAAASRCSKLSSTSSRSLAARKRVDRLLGALA